MYTRGKSFDTKQEIPVITDQWFWNHFSSYYFVMCQHFWVAYKQCYEIQSFRGSRSEANIKNNAWVEPYKRRKHKLNKYMHVFYTSRDQEQFSITYKLWMFNISHGKSLKWPAFYLSCSVNIIAKHGIFLFSNVRIFWTEYVTFRFSSTLKYDVFFFFPRFRLLWTTEVWCNIKFFL